MKTIIKSVLLLALFATIFVSCLKDHIYYEETFELSETEKRFLNKDALKSGSITLKDKFIETVAADLETQNEKDRFIEEFVGKHGYPDWERSRWFLNDFDEEVIQIPVLKDNDYEVRAVILGVEHNGRLGFKLLLRDNFDQFADNVRPLPDSEIIMEIFMVFDFMKFRKSSYLPEGELKFGTPADTTGMALKGGEYGFETKCYFYTVIIREVVQWKYQCVTKMTYYPITEETADEEEPGGGGSNWHGETSGNGGEGGSDTPGDDQENLKPLPTFAGLEEKFSVVANMAPGDVYQLIGGNVLQNRINDPDNFKNACALRMSYALNRITGHAIPYTKGKTLSGDYNKDSVKEWYFFRVTDMVNYLNAKYGMCAKRKRSELTGKKGIILQTECGWGDATGHIDLWKNNDSVGKYYEVCDEIYFWEY